MYNLTVAGAHTYIVGDGQWLVHNCALGTAERKYVASPKHARGGWGSPMDLTDEVAQDVLNKGTGYGKQVYGFRDGKLYIFQPDNAGGFHGYLASSGIEVPVDVLRQWLDQGVISKVEYEKLRRGKW